MRAYDRGMAASPDRTERARFAFASALSDEPRTRPALDDVMDQLQRKLPGGADLVMIFATPHHLEGLGLIHERLTRVLEPRCELGVTAEGVIGVGREIESEPGLSVLAGSMPQAELRAFALEPGDLRRMLEADQPPRQAIGLGAREPQAILLFADPFSTPVIQLLPAMNRWFPRAIVSGGVVSGTRTAGGNRLLCNGRIERAGLIGLTLGAGATVTTTVSQGCRPIGSPLVITKTRPDRSHVVVELGGRNPLGTIHDLVHSLGEDDQQLVQTNGLLVGCVIDEYKPRFGRGDFVIRGIIGVDQEQGHIAIGDPQLRVGQTIQFHVRDQKTAEEDFAFLLEAQKLYDPVADGSGGALLFTCNGRGSRLFEQPSTDARLVQAALGDAPLAGFFAAGEFGPVGGRNHLHGHTASLVVLRPPDPGA